MANKRWVIDYPSASASVSADLLWLVQAGVNKQFSLAALFTWLTEKILGTGVSAFTITAGVVNLDLSLGDEFTLALTANVTSITFSNLPASGIGRTIAIRFRQDATGSRTVTLPLSFKAITGSDTVVQAAANAYTIFMATTFDQGTRWEYSMKAGSA